MNSREGLAERDSVRIHRKDDSGRITTKILAIRYEVNGMLLLLDGDWRQNDELYLIQTASMTRSHKPVLPKNLNRFHKFPSNHTAPAPRNFASRWQKTRDFVRTGKLYPGRQGRSSARRSDLSPKKGHDTFQQTECRDNAPGREKPSF